MIIGLEGAHPACVGPLIELLLEDRAPVRVCFTARELLDAPEDARVVLLHAARDAEFLNMVRPVVSERRLRVLVWLQPGDRRELSRRARDFLDWMQESVDIPEFVPRYAEEALRRVFDEGASISWEGPFPSSLVTPITVLLPHDDDALAIEAMRRGPVVIHRPRDAEEVAHFEAMRSIADGGHGILWEEPAVLPAGATRVIAEPLDWEVAAGWLEEAGVEDPRIEAAKLQLDPLAISSRAGREPPSLPSATDQPRAFDFHVGPSEGAAHAHLAFGGSTKAVQMWWAELAKLCEPTGPPEDTNLIVQRPAAWPGLEPIADQLRARSQPEVHVVTGAKGSGVSTELRFLGLKLHEQRCVVVTLDVWHHFSEVVRDPAAIERLTSWELIVLLGLAAIRVGRDRWHIRWRRESDGLREAIRTATGTDVDVDQLASALGGAGAPDVRLPSAGGWTLPMGSFEGWGATTNVDGADVRRVVDELAKVVDDGVMAMMVVRGAGFPRAQLPFFTTPFLFWNHVVHHAHLGALRGGLEPIVSEAARMYPGNPVFARYRDPWSRTRTTEEKRAAAAESAGIIISELIRATGREVVFVIDGLDHLPRLSPIGEMIDSLRSADVHADLISTAPQALPGQSPQSHHVQSFNRLDDVPVLDVHQPTQHGPGVGFLRELLERRLASNPYERPEISEDVLDRLCWASGGRPGECLSLVRSLAERAHDSPGTGMEALTAEVLRERRSQLAVYVTREGHELLRALLREFVKELPGNETARALYSGGALRLYPVPEGGRRALPHPLLIEGLLEG